MSGSLRRRGLDQEDVDMLRDLAGLPVRSDAASAHLVRSHVVEIQRDASGRVIGSIERIEDSAYLDRTINRLG